MQTGPATDIQKRFSPQANGKQLHQAFHRKVDAALIDLTRINLPVLTERELGIALAQVQCRRSVRPLQMRTESCGVAMKYSLRLIRDHEPETNYTTPPPPRATRQL